MQKITPFLWYDGQAEEAMHFYCSIFKNAQVGEVMRYGEGGMGPQGKVMSVTFQLEGLEFMALNGGPDFTFTPAISFFVSCETEEEIDGLFGNLSEGGKVLMELARYPFSEKFGWVEDKFGLSWQLNLVGHTPKITPFLMFVGEQSGKAEEAINFYVSQFENSSVVRIVSYGAGEGEPAGTVKHAVFTLNGQEFMAMGSSRGHAFTFSPAISFFVNCETQEEVDGLWEKLLVGGEEDQCGWLRDKYGVSWQIIPSILGKLLYNEDPEKAGRVMQAMLKMKKLEIKVLQEA